MSALEAITSRFFMALTVAAVPTGMKAGVLISPWAVFISPSLAFLSFCVIVKEKLLVMKKFLPLLILAVIIVFLAVLVYNSSIKSDFSKQNLQISEFELVDLYDEEEKLRLLDLKNGQNRYSILNFFASWCSTCLAEHGLLNRLSNDNSFDFFGVAWHDFSKNTLDYLKKNGDPYDRVFLDGRNELGKIIGLQGVPETILVNSDGVVVMRHQGNLTEAKLYEILNFIAKN